MTEPRVSVILPVFNAERYVREALDSILAQTFADFELIVVEDGSKDDSIEILQDFVKKDDRIVLVRNKTNQGLINGLNRGLELARGEYIARMDADDINLPERLALQVAYLDRHPDVGLLGTNIIYIDRDGKLLNNGRPKDKSPLSSIVIAWMLLWRCPIYHPTVMIRKFTLDETGFRYDAKYRYAEDRELWARLVKTTRIASLPDVLLRYRIIPTSISRKWKDEQVAADRMITHRELKSLLGITFSETALNTLVGALPGYESNNDFKGASDLLLNTYQCFCTSSLSNSDEIQIQRDVVSRMITVAEEAAKYSFKTAVAVLRKLHYIPFQRFISLAFTKRLAKIFLISAWSYRITESSSSCR